MKTKDEVLTLEADDTQTLTWYIDTVFVVHHGMKIKLEQCLHQAGKVTINDESNKYNSNSKNSTEAELQAVDE